jgi:hypothetical protein
MNATERTGNGTHLLADQDRTLTTKAYLVGEKGPLLVGDAQRTAGQLVPEATTWLPRIRDILVDQQKLEVIDLVSDHDRDLAVAQWEAEEAARIEAKQQAVPTPTGIYELPASKMPEPDLTVLVCANCRRKNSFDHAVADDEWWQCSGCMQRQCGEQARKGTLQIVAMPADSHAVNHNWKPPSWRQT